MSDLIRKIAAGPFDPTLESLRRFECPDWFRDAKLAFWSHWGPQSVPMYGDWYARHMYVEGSEQYRYHWRVYGHPSKFGYKEILPFWKAENFDPHGLMRLFVEAGAKYFVGQAMHHDNFDNFDSAHNRWNAVQIGPQQDIVQLWRDAARAHSLPFGLSEHLGASFNWFDANKGADKIGPYAGAPYDGSDPAFADLYHCNQGYALALGDNPYGNWYTDNTEFQRHWFDRIKDVIDKYQPDLLYSDGGVPFGEIGLGIVAHLYNTSAAVHGGVNRAVYNQKDTDPSVYTIGVLDVERGQLSDIAEHPWQTDTSVGDWFYNVRDVYKTAGHVLETLVDIVSKNGNLLLNIPQRPDGAIDDECTFLLNQMALWMSVNGEGIFGSRPWDIAGEGGSAAEVGAFKEGAVDWSPTDFRFTRNGDTLYAYQMRRPEDGKTLIRSLASGRTRRVTDVRLLGYGSAYFQQTTDGLAISLPPAPLLAAPHGFAILQE
ncbi:MAG: alpha-L-fucosidase [Capsulimonas sp.]|uniref:alpha-L-fucosidase n=1 Tax=Capsulimonas sp. TaxID=2494211 RepID=UPI003265E7DC